MVTPVRPEPGVDAQGRARARRRAACRRGRRARPPARQVARRITTTGPLDVPPTSEHHAGRIPARWSRGPRSTSRPATSSRSCWRSASRRRSRCRRSRSIARCGGPIRRRYLYLPRLRRLRGRRLEPGNPGARARRHRHDPPDRRHAAARRDAARGQGAGRRTARRSEGARRAPDAARSRPQRRRPRRRDRHASRSPTSSSSSATAT